MFGFFPELQFQGLATWRRHAPQLCQGHRFEASWRMWHLQGMSDASGPGGRTQVAGWRCSVWRVSKSCPQRCTITGTLMMTWRGDTDTHTHTHTHSYTSVCAAILPSIVDHLIHNPKRLLAKPELDLHSFYSSNANHKHRNSLFATLRAGFVSHEVHWS